MFAATATDIYVNFILMYMLHYKIPSCFGNYEPSLNGLSCMKGYVLDNSWGLIFLICTSEISAESYSHG